MAKAHVFADPSGKRWRTLTRTGAIAGLAVAVVSTVFVVTFLFMPLLPIIPGLTGPAAHANKPSLPALPDRESRLARYLLQRSRMALFREVSAARERKAAPRGLPAAGQGAVIAFYAPWEETGLHSLRAHAQYLTHVMPEWLSLDPAGTRLVTRDWDPSLTPHNLDVVQICRANGVQIHPILNNAQSGFFDPKRARHLLGSPKDQVAVAEQARDFLVKNGFQGLNLDFENLAEEDYPRLPAFVRVLAAVLHPAGLAVSVDVEAGRSEIPVRALAKASDFVVLMAYDEHYATGGPGPIASAGWYYQSLQKALKQAGPDKLVVGLGNYAYDWTVGQKGVADTISYQSALILAQDNHPDEPPSKIMDFDDDAMNSLFNYEDDDGKAHEVWMLDAVSAYNQWSLAAREQVRGAALWVLGEEDPGVWTFLRKASLYTPPAPKVLDTIEFPYAIEFEGEGELLSVMATPHQGSREVTVDPNTGLVTDMEYHTFPSSFVIRRAGYTPGLIALTFDDGPDPHNTPEILDVLARERVHATFFVIGESAEHYPDLVRREYREGHEIGSHTFTHPNLAAVSHRRAVLELNVTQRALQAILGRTSLLFRAPYNADAEPVSAEEVLPIQIASQLGYITIGETIDPQDWNRYRAGPGGAEVERTAHGILNEILHQLDYIKGNAILLHDGGGDRSLTVQALARLIPDLRQRGYRFVTVSELIGKTRDGVMLPIRPEDQLVVGFDRLMFESVFTLETFLSLAFIAAIALGVGRVLFLVPLALASWVRERRASWPDDYRPEVSACIAAYNESPVIARTIESLLSSGYPVLEVLVVDDGSTDGTAEEIARAFGEDPRVRVLRQANAGKAAALNRALSEARGEVLVCMDADTQVAPSAIGRLVRHFADARVAAVAGNVKVGNRVNVLTTWQSIEYVSSQNLDRRVYSVFNAITVVPGAIGAWRRSAVLDLQGFRSDSMAEDMDLTWRLRRAGWRVTSDQRAVGFTEAPQTFKGFFRQRFRWTYGTLQCLWKHKPALFRYGWFGWLALPALWLFQIAFQVLAPLVDLQVLYTLGVFVKLWTTRGVLTQDWQPLPLAMHTLLQVLFYYGLFFGVELLGALVAYALDRERPWSLWWLFLQRFFYRQILYAVLWKSLVTALKGVTAGWGTIERRGTVAGGAKG